jgi:hypothetical protein
MKPLPLPSAGHFPPLRDYLRLCSLNLLGHALNIRPEKTAVCAILDVNRRTLYDHIAIAEKILKILDGEHPPMSHYELTAFDALTRYYKSDRKIISPEPKEPPPDIPRWKEHREQCERHYLDELYKKGKTLRKCVELSGIPRVELASKFFRVGIADFRADLTLLPGTDKLRLYG